MIKLYGKLSNLFFQDVSNNNNTCVLNITDDTSVHATDHANDHANDHATDHASSRQLVIICDNNEFYDTNEYVRAEDHHSSKNYTPTKKKLLFNDSFNTVINVDDAINVENVENV